MTHNIPALQATLKAKSGARLKMWLDICARCGLCADACHFFASDPRPEHVPAYRLKPLIAAIEQGGEVDEQTLAWLRDVDFGTCTMCQRCTMFCPYGIGIAMLVRTARALAVSQGMVPPGLARGAENHLAFGNNLGMTEEEYRDTVDWQLEELREEMPQAEAPMDKEGAEFLVTFHPRDIKFYPQNLYNYLKIYNAAGIDFTLTSQGWDSTNIGLFMGDDAVAGKMSAMVVGAAERLRAKTVITAE